MSKYDKDYFFVHKLRGRENLPSLTPDKNTEDRIFRYEAQATGSPPIVFFNGASDSQRLKKVKAVSVPPRILFDGSNPLVPGDIREKLIKLDVPHLHMHPSVYIHDDKRLYEDYWYMTFTQQLDCWDRDNSSYEDEPLELGGFKLYSIYTYSLDETVLDKIPLQQRLLFEIGGTQDGMVVCHQSIMHLFINEGVQLTRIDEY